MSAAVVDITIEKNATFLMRVTLTDTAVEPNAPVDLTDCTITSQIRQFPHHGVVEEFTTAIGAPTEGKFTMSLTADQTEALPVTGLKYDVSLLLADGVTKKRVLQGNIKVSEAITI